jgi:hypothetical protein
MKENRINNQEQVEKPIERSFKKTDDKRVTLQESVPKARQNTRQKFYPAEQGRSNSNRKEQNTVSDMRLQSNRSGKASRESFSNTNSSIGTAYSRSTGQQRVQQSGAGRMQQHSTGGMQGYSGRGR